MHISSNFQFIVFYFFFSSSSVGQVLHNPLLPYVLALHHIKSWRKKKLLLKQNTTLYGSVRYGHKLSLKKWSTERRHNDFVCVCSGELGEGGTSRARKHDRDNREGRGGIRSKNFQRSGNLEEISPEVRGSQQSASLDFIMCILLQYIEIYKKFNNQTDQTGTTQKNL